MKIGIFSDVHGNIYAFERVWEALKAEACDLYIFLGDICGYYYHQNEVIEMLKKTKGMIAVLGNHDDLFLKMSESEGMRKSYAERYGSSCALLMSSIKEDNLSFLKGLPRSHVLDEYNLCAFHGSPWDSLNGYVYPAESLDRFEGLKFRFVLLGHTHHCMDRKAGNVRVINPGSCGQPRDEWHPSYATLNPESGDVKIRRVEYNRDWLMKEVMRRDEGRRYLIDVLTREKKGVYA